MINQFPSVFTDVTGKFQGEPIKIQLKSDMSPVIQPPHRVPMHYWERLRQELEKMKEEDIMEGPITIEEPGTFLSNLVITDKKGTGRIRVTLDCQTVNKAIYATHEPIPTPDELRHYLGSSDRFSMLDMTNCYCQFEIEPSARKLYAFCSPWGIYQYKRMVMGTSPASSEIQKCIREAIKDCKNTIHIKDDILVFGAGQEHDKYLEGVLRMLQEKSITLRPEKCRLGQPEVKWFGNIYSKYRVSPDPEKCAVIQNWPPPKSNAEVKSFLQTVQFNSKFMGGDPELSEPLRTLTKKNARFIWGEREMSAFKEIKRHLCSDRVLVPYDTRLNTRLYVDTSHIGTQATVAQCHIINSEKFWRPVNHTSRAWTSAESGYGQVERESNGILTGMHMNKMYTLGTYVQVVTDHQPLIPIYNSPNKPKQLRVDRHRTKLLPFQYDVVYEPGKETPCDYGSRHPPECAKFNEQQIKEWCIETGTDIYVNRVLEEILPQAITLDILRRASSKDKMVQLLISYIKTQNKSDCKKHLKPYYGIFDELTEVNGVNLRGSQIVIPESLQTDIIGLAHEGHQYAEKTLQLLRQTCWFPGMKKQVLSYVESCLPCNAAQAYTPPVPLEPNLLPHRPWQRLHADFKGPIEGRYYLHVIIDQYFKYPEVDLVTSTSFKKLKPVLDRVFATHRFPEAVTTGNDPRYSSYEMEKYAKAKGFRLTPVTPDDPQCNGFLESFVKVMCKLLHTAVSENEDPKTELYNYLLHYRATPHRTTGRSPAELLFNRKLQTKLPQIFTVRECDDLKDMRERHDEMRLKQKKYFDIHKCAKTKNIAVGDKVLIWQNKTTLKPPFDASPYTVTEVNGNRVLAQRHDGSTRIRDKNNLKKLKDRPVNLIPTWEKYQPTFCTDYTKLDIEGNFWKSAADATTGADTLHAAELPEAVGTDQHQTHSESSNEPALFEVNEEAAARMEALLHAAEQQAVMGTENTSRVTRSQ